MLRYPESNPAMFGIKILSTLPHPSETLIFAGASIKSEEEEFARVLEARAKAAEGKIKVVDINKKESEVEVSEIMTLSNVVEWVKETFPGFVHQRIPVGKLHITTRVQSA